MVTLRTVNLHFLLSCHSFLQMITLIIQDGAPYIYMICWLSIKIVLSYIMGLFLETLFFMNVTGYFLLLLLTKHMNIITALSNQMGELLASQKEKQLFCAGWLQGLKSASLWSAMKIRWVTIQRLSIMRMSPLNKKKVTPRHQRNDWNNQRIW